MRPILITICFFSLFCSSFSQINNEFKDAFIEAESYFLYEEYEEALPIYTKLLRNNPYNIKLKYLIGRCLLNDPYRTDKAITYLEQAVKNINPKYKDNYQETLAPFDALFYLAEAYQKNNRLNEAMDQYEKFLVVMDEEIYDKQIVLKRIESCKYAKKIMENPIDISPQILNHNINSNFEEFNPVISGDGKTLAFTRKLKFYDGIFVSYKTEDGWTNPENIMSQLKVDGGVSTSSLSFNGKTLYLYNIDGYDGNIYISVKESNQWSGIYKLNDNINTKYWESSAFESPDGKTLYFSSNRPGGFGGLDLYVSYRWSNTDWGPAVNLGSDVNTEYNEDSPVVINDQKILFFSSNGHVTVGDYDYFISHKVNEIWTKPYNPGYPLNTTGKEIHLSVIEDGSLGILAIFNEKENIGLKDIFSFKPEALKSFKEIKEKIKINEQPQIEIRERDTFSIALSDLENKSSDSDKENKEISDSTEQINQEIIPIPDSIKESQPKEIIEDNHSPTINLTKTNYEVKSGAELTIPLQVEKNTNLKIKIVNDSNTIFIQEYNIDDKNFIFSHKPNDGLSIIYFELTDEKGNKTIKKIDVNCSPSITLDENIEKDKRDDKKEIVNLKKLINRLIGFSENRALRTKIDSFSQEETEVKTLFAKLFHYSLDTLGYDSNIESPYSIKDILLSILNSTGLVDININEFYNVLIQNSTPSIRDYITGLQINEQGFTPVSLLEHIIKAEPIENFSPDDLYITLSNILLKYGTEESVYKTKEP